APLFYRVAGRGAMSGRGAMVGNGRPRWTCRTRVSQAVAADGKLQLEPLRNFTVVKDLTVDMAAFFDKWRDAKGYFEPGHIEKDGEQGSPMQQADFQLVPPATPER